MTIPLIMRRSGINRFVLMMISHIHSLMDGPGANCKIAVSKRSSVVVLLNMLTKVMCFRSHKNAIRNPELSTFRLHCGLMTILSDVILPMNICAIVTLLSIPQELER